jgi:hypothetical protein
MTIDPEYFRSGVPVGRSGAWVIERHVIADRPYDPASDPRPECFKFRPGQYTILRRDGTHFMTDFYDEWFTQRIGITEAIARGGNVLITGLGIGLVAEAMLKEPESHVEHITIVELSEDVIGLVAPYLTSRYPEKIEIVHGDAFTWQPPSGRRFTVGWHDIWPDPWTPENEAEMSRLDEHYRASCDWQGFWPREYVRAATVAV